MDINGRIRGVCGTKNQTGGTPISRSTAIDLMVEAIEAGDHIPDTGEMMAGDAASDEIKLGDEVQIVGPLDKEWENHVEELEAYVGKTGQVKNLYKEYGDTVYVEFSDSDSRNFHRKNVARCKAGEVSDTEESPSQAASRFASQLEEAKGLIAKLQKNIADGVKSLPDHHDLRWPSVCFLSGDGLASAIQCVTNAYHKTSTPDPYAHLPHGGWWAKTDDRLFHYPNNYSLSTRFTLDGLLHEIAGDKGSAFPWDAIKDKTKGLTRDQIIAIIEAHKAKEQPKPEPCFGGPWDKEAVMWAKERGYYVAAWRVAAVGDTYIANSFQESSLSFPWSVIDAAGAYVPNTPRYILAPIAKPKPTPAEKIIDDGIGGGMTLRQHYAGLAMQSLMLESQWQNEMRDDWESALGDLAESACTIADALIAELRGGQ